MNKDSRGLLPVVFLIYTLLGVVYFYNMLNEGIPAGDSWVENYPLRLYYSSNFGLVSWLPYIFLGLPFLGMFHVGMFYSLNIMYFLLPPFYAFQLNIVLHYILSAFFTFLYARLINIPNFPSFMAGLIFASSGFLMAHKGHTSMINAAVWLPLLLFLYEKIRATLNPKYSAWAALVIAIQVFAGHYQICVYTYFVFRMVGEYIEQI